MQIAPRWLMLAAALANFSSVNAHVTYKELTEAQPLEYAGLFGNRNWSNGTRPELGDSHDVLFARFHLEKRSVVQLSFATQRLQREVNGQVKEYPAGLDPAFSLYRGLLPPLAHDNTDYDPLIPFDEQLGTLAASPTDAHPNANHTYQAHDGYRDTLNYSTLGGIDPGTGEPTTIFSGQFDALNSWSMANDTYDDPENRVEPGSDIEQHDDGTATHKRMRPDPSDPEKLVPALVWSSIKYLTHRNEHTGIGDTPDTTPETASALLLEPGDYTVAAGGGCPGCPGAGRDEGESRETFGGLLSMHVVPCAAGRSRAYVTSPQQARLDVTVGEELSGRLFAVDCDGDAIVVETAGKIPEGVVLGENSQPDPNTGTVARQWTWSPTAEQAGTKGKRYSLGYRASTPANRTSTSRIKRIAVRVWPAGISAATAYQVSFDQAEWSQRRGVGQLKLGGTIRFNPMLTRDERAAILAAHQLSIMDQGTGATLVQALTVNAKGRWSTSLTPSQALPCQLTAQFGSRDASLSVKKLPGCAVSR